MAERRLSAAVRVLARRRAYLAAMAAAGLVLTGSLVVLMAFAGLWAWALPDAWGLDVVGPVVALLLWLPLLAAALSFLSLGVRTYTLWTSGPPPTTPAQMVGGLGGLGVHLLGRRLRARRGVLGWITDPWGAAAATVLSRTLPPEHPMAALLQAAGLEPRRPPTRGAGWLALGVALTGLAAWLVADQLSPALGSLLLAPFLLMVAASLLLGAAVKGVLAGAWDRYLMDRLGEGAEATFQGFAGPARGPTYGPRR